MWQLSTAASFYDSTDGSIKEPETFLLCGDMFDVTLMNSSRYLQFASESNCSKAESSFLNMTIPTFFRNHRFLLLLVGPQRQLTVEGDDSTSELPCKYGNGLL